MKNYIAFDFTTDGYIKMLILFGKTKYDVADKYCISRNNIYQYDLIISMFKWLYNNNLNYFYKINGYLYLYNREHGEREPVHKMITIKKALKAYLNR